MHLLLSLTLALPILAKTSIFELGCYAHVPALTDKQQHPFQSRAHCEDKCQKSGFRVAALTHGSTCACAHQLPKQSDLVDDDKCNVMCSGWPEEKCKSSFLSLLRCPCSGTDSDSLVGGGATAYTVISTGEYAAVSNSTSPNGNGDHDNGEDDDDEDDDDDSSTARNSMIAGGIIVAPTHLNPSSVPTGILTAPASMITKATATAATSASSAIASVNASASASPTVNAGGSLRAVPSSVFGALVAGLGLLL